MILYHHHDVRTTITLDQDVAARLKAEVRRSGRSFKETVNALLRLALTIRREHKPAEPFAVQARPLGLRPGLDYDRTSELVEHLEGPLHR
jgi:ribbon-helix-helix CopG family protein